MGADEQEKQPNETPPAETDEALNPEEAKRRAYRKKKPVGPIMKPLSDKELDDLVNDPEVKERDHLADAMPKGREAEDFDAF